MLHDLRGLQVGLPPSSRPSAGSTIFVAIPYFRHAGPRLLPQHDGPSDIAIYLRSLFTALASVHHHNILHRDIKPTTFLYDPSSRRGVLVDFGPRRARGATTTTTRLCHDDPSVRRGQASRTLDPRLAKGGYLREDARPLAARQPRGRAGFRARGALQVHRAVDQDRHLERGRHPADDSLAALVFNSADGVEAMLDPDFATMFGRQRMQAAALLHGCMLETTIQTRWEVGVQL